MNSIHDFNRIFERNPGLTLREALTYWYSLSKVPFPSATIHIAKATDVREVSRPGNRFHAHENPGVVAMQRLVLVLVLRRECILMEVLPGRSSQSIPETRNKSTGRAVARTGCSR